MSWSLRLHNGDLDVQSARLGTVTGADKLVQDFRCALLESLGNDDMQPAWGSTLDGGIDIDGTFVPGVIGSSDLRLATLAIESEVRRIAGIIQSRQLARVQQDRLTYNKVTLTASEILVGVVNVSFMQTEDDLSVLVTLQTGANGLIDLAVPFPADSLVAN